MPLYIDPVSQGNVSAVERGGTNSEAGRLREKQALQEYERLFLFEMLKAMRKSVSRTDLFGGGSKREMYEELLDDVWAGEMAKSGQLGVADIIEKQLHLRESQGALAAERRAARDAAGVQGLPLQPPPADALPVHPPRQESFPLERRGAEFFEAPWIRPGLPLSGRDVLSEPSPLPINNLTGPAPRRSGPGGTL